MDMCILTTPVVVTLLACGPGPTVCHTNGDKQFCIPGPIQDCNNSSPYYLCTRPDNTTYTIPWTEDIGPNLVGRTSP